VALLVLCHHHHHHHNGALAFTIGVQQQQQRAPVVAPTPSSGRSTEDAVRQQVRSCAAPLFMGRAAAVRANTKAKTDMKKTKTNAIYVKKIIMAVKEGGSPDPNANRMLYDVIKQAKANSVPVDNIARAIKKASEGSVGDFKESTFEAYGFGGCSMIVNVLSDNNNRATSDVKAAVNRRDGKIAESGSVMFLYDRRGKVDVPAAVDEESLLEAAIEAGCDDYDLAPGDEPGTTVIYTDPKEGFKMLEALNSLGHEDGVKISLVYVTKAPVECTDADFEKNMEIIEALETLDDVDSVEHNMSN
jgi:YebC/PmpR family DNA-binding regulatory protein